MSARLSAEFEKRFPRGAAIRMALDRPADAFSVTVLFGPSGCGKTTVLRCLAGLERPDAGTIRFDDESWFDADAHRCVPPQRRNVGFLHQDYALFPHLTVEENIGYGLRSLQREARRETVGVLMERLQLQGLGRRLPRQLSGGQQQRVALARAVARKPRLLLLDEPLSALDAMTREELRRELRSILADLGVPCLLVTHDRLEAAALGDWAVVMDLGRVLQTGPLDEVFSRPVDGEVARMVGVETVIQAQVIQVRDGLATIRVGAGGVELTALAPDIREGPAAVCIRGEEVTLLSAAAAHTSARNQLSARVTSIMSDGPLVRVGLHCGFDLVALITRPAREELALREGSPVTVLIKAPAIHVIPRPTT